MVDPVSRDCLASMEQGTDAYCRSTQVPFVDQSMLVPSLTTMGWDLAGRCSSSDCKSNPLVAQAFHSHAKSLATTNLTAAQSLIKRDELCRGCWIRLEYFDHQKHDNRH